MATLKSNLEFYKDVELLKEVDFGNGKRGKLIKLKGDDEVYVDLRVYWNNRPTKRGFRINLNLLSEFIK